MQEQALKEFERDVVYLDALSNETRQKIIILLGSHLEEGLTVNELAEKLELSQPATSHNLKALKDVGMISSTRSGTQQFYYLTLDETILRLESLLAAVKASYPYSAAAKVIESERKSKK
ncbi:winged helix-turn-helix transcriptional regulator [Lactobacillus sp. CC-MHH1034]|uniref:ArsR/SmtB family transcription factor n=1 Tax=Agrilactobacillus fermenti TaxID=2586909 RepID=UPI001E3D7C12|nr:metalloregulator ArsR/SmtB family transcription factor [Agrilactobacillus fermenti]MCD2255914.1 winged helix-turn-helix transcriptional regulator [Agrilactobacillus fermenti]